MKKLESLVIALSLFSLLAYPCGKTVAIAADTDSLASDEVLPASISDNNRSLEEVYSLLKQFISDQKDNGNHAFYLANVYESSYFSDNNGDIPTGFQNKIVVEYFWEDEETVLTAVKSFMQENGIDESLVAYEFLVDAVESDSDPESLDKSLKNAYTLLKKFVSDQKVNGNHAFYLANVYESSYFSDNNGDIPTEFQNKIVVEYFWEDEETVLTAVKSFMQENGIDESLVAYEFLVDAVEKDVKPNLEEIRNLLVGYIEQRGYKARAEVADEFENTVTVVFEQLPIGAESYDFDALTADFNAFFAENQINTDTFDFLVIADDSGAKVQTDRITDKQLLNWVKIDYEKKLGIAVYPEIVSKSDSTYEFAVKGKEGNVLDTYMINPQTGTGISDSGEEVNLPQTGMSSLHKVFAGLAALMGITGIGLVKRSRKEDSD